MGFDPQQGSPKQFGLTSDQKQNPGYLLYLADEILPQLYKGYFWVYVHKPLFVGSGHFHHSLLLDDSVFSASLVGWSWTHVFWGSGNALTSPNCQPAFPTKVMERKASMLAQRGKVGEQTAKAGIRRRCWDVGGGWGGVSTSGFTPLKFNSSPLKIGRAPKRKLIFQSHHFCRGELLNFGGCSWWFSSFQWCVFFLYAFYTKILRKWFKLTHIYSNGWLNHQKVKVLYSQRLLLTSKDTFCFDRLHVITHPLYFFVCISSTNLPLIRWIPSSFFLLGSIGVSIFCFLWSKQLESKNPRP